MIPLLPKLHCQKNPCPKRDAYRYGFNGHERDDEIKGAGNSVNFKYRMHDPRIGRFLSLDPDRRSYPSTSPFSFAANNPVRYVDHEGRFPWDPLWKRAVRAAADNQGFLLVPYVHHEDGKSWYTRTVTFKDVEFEMRVEFNETMSKSEIRELLQGEGLNNNNSYFYFRNFGNGDWDHYSEAYALAMWYEFYALEEPPFMAEMAARMVMGIYGFFHGLATGEDWLNGSDLTTTDHILNSLDVIPVEAAGKYALTAVFIKVSHRSYDILPIIKRLSGANKYGYCRDFAGAFMKRFSSLKDQLNLKRYRIDTGDYKYLEANGKGLATEGTHDVISMTLDGKEYIFDNMNPEGILKQDWIDSFVGSKGPGLGEISGQELLDASIVTELK